MVELSKIKVGMVVAFAGYSDQEMMDDDKIFAVGQRVRIEQINADGGMVAMPADADGPGDTVFPEEISLIDAEVSEEAPAAAEEAPAPKAKGKAKAKAVEAEPAEEAAPVAEAPAQVPATNDSMTGVVVDSPAIQSMLAEQDALDAAKSLKERIEETYYLLGGILAHIYKEGVYKSLGYSGKRGFADYVDKELGIQYRKAMYLINIYVRVRALGVDETRLREIGWSKAKELVQYATADNFDALVDYAKDHTRDELGTYLKTQMVSDGTESTEGGKVKKTKIGFTLFADQAETVTRALDAAKNMAGSDDLNQALEYICAEWSQMTESVDVPLADAIAHLEAKYGVKLAVATEGATSEGQADQVMVAGE